LDYVVDQGVQVFGGMGYSADVPMERAYRDARISRIYEGTNEINRMLMVGMLLKRALKGELDIYGPAMEVAKELTAVPSFDSVDTTHILGKGNVLLKELKNVYLMVAGKTAHTFQNIIEEEQ